MRILYHSTNRELPNGFKTEVPFNEAVQLGLAVDGGLFMPNFIPRFSKKEISGMRGRPYAKTAFLVLQKFLKHEISDVDLKKIVKKTYTFDIPIEKIDDITFLARLDQGPTASFKDFAAQFMAKLLPLLFDKGKQFTILVATSGDTGSAIGEAFRGVKGFRVFLLYPKDEVSSIQKEHMDRIGNNVTAISIKGKFDDCQNMVKKAFADPDLKELNLTSANSINIARLLPQIVYYFAIYSKLRTSKKVVFSIPSGNFGSSLGCEMARRMGLPVSKIIIATNENDSFPRFLASGSYKKISPSRKCLSNAMNVGNPSNLARYFDLYGGVLDKEGRVHKQPVLELMRKNLFSTSISDKKTIKTITDFYKRKKILLEPHGAVGVAALHEYRVQTHSKQIAICLETAHPSKFPEIIKERLKINPKMPNSLMQMYKRRRQMHTLNNDYHTLKRYLIVS